MWTQFCFKVKTLADTDLLSCVVLLKNTPGCCHHWVMWSPFSSCNTHITEQHLTTGPFIYPHWFPIDASPYDWGPKESPPRGPFNNKRSQLRQQAASLNEQQCHSSSVRVCVCVSHCTVCVCVVKHHWLVAAEWSCDQGPLMTVRSCEQS